MFWTKQISSDSQETPWAVPYGDLMSLLLALFVMIAAMSELKAGQRFDSVRNAVRAAFGYDPMAAGLDTNRPLTFSERLERAGLLPESTVRLQDHNSRNLAVCELIKDGSEMIVRFDGADCFDPLRTELRSSAEAAVARIGAFLQTGTSRIEVRGFAADEDGAGRPTPAGVVITAGGTQLAMDGWQRAYARARTVADILIGKGVDPDRMFLSVWHVPAMTERALSVGPAEDVEAEIVREQRELSVMASAEAASQRRIEIVMHAKPGIGLDGSGTKLESVESP